MIINIPVQVDEHSFEDAIKRDYENKLFSEMVKAAKNAIAFKSNKYYGNKFEDGMIELVKEQIDAILQENKDKIVTAASQELAERIARSKKGKAILEELSND